MEFVPVEPDDGDDPFVAWARGEVARPTPPTPPERRRGAASNVLMAAMIGLADALGYETRREETVEVADAPKGGDGLDLDWGRLTPLDPVDELPR